MGDTLYRQFDWKYPGCCSSGYGVVCFTARCAKGRVKKAPAYLELTELPMYLIVLIKDEQKKNDVRDVFISYLEVELRNLP